MLDIILEDIILNDPGYYSGRGATPSDLSSYDLFNIYRSIEKNINLEAAKEFVLLVENLEVASATGLILSLRKLEKNNWIFSKDVVNVENIHCENEGHALGTVMSSLGGLRKVDDTLDIVSSFLRAFNKEHITLKYKDHRVYDYYRYGRF